MAPLDLNLQIEALRVRMAQVADLQRARREFLKRETAWTRPVDEALHLAQIDAALRLARNTLSSKLRNLPERERTRFIKAQIAAAADPGLARACSKIET
jgi:hypothetical protein